ncbi:MAG TPA: BamA/TamA family outer membrane protein [Gemmatimonadales bacterium]|nr:BamA/TamA family outer membrane protein [Gemmatimonadales bacterium]
MPPRHRPVLALLAVLLTAPLVVAAPTRALAQDEGQPDEPFGQPWGLTYFPYLASGANEFPLLAFRVQYRQLADYDSPLPFSANLAADAGLGFKGSRFLAFRFRAPGIAEGWRFSAVLGANRQARLGFYGLGNDTEHDEDLETEAQPFLYRVERTRYLAQAEVTRRLVRRVSVAVAGGIEESRFDLLPGPSLFRAATGGREPEVTDVTGRVSLIFDTRDNEYNTTRGVFLDAGVQVGSGGGNYTRLYAAGRVYLPVREGTIVAARIVAAGMGGSPPLNARFEVPTWENNVLVLGGEESHRGFDAGRLIGKHVLFGNLEVRHDILNLGDFGAFTALAFLDAGRVFEGEPFRLTTDDLQVGGGGGFAIRILRSTIYPFNFGVGPDGFEFSVGGGWMF